MRLFLIVIFFLVVLILGVFGYRFLRPIDQPTEQMIALANHFNSHDIKGHIYPVRSLFSHSEITAAAAFQIDGFPLPIAFEQSPTEKEAALHFTSIKNSPNLMHPQRNGTLVMSLPMWGDDTGEMTNKILNAFTSFKN